MRESDKTKPANPAETSADASIPKSETALDATLPMGMREDGASDVGRVAVVPLASGAGAAAPETRYRTEALLGEGGMGEVRLCADAQIGRRVAMKVIRAEFAKDATLRTRFLREARVQGQLEHPVVVPVYDLGRDASGTDFFTMKRVRGQTLDHVIDALRDGDADTLREHGLHKLLAAFSQACLAIHFAHERGVLHRDLKPSNLMLGRFGEVYVLDWGLAKIVGEDDASPERIELDVSSSGAATTFGEALGTPGYAAPEQICGEEIDARADVWALGAILFEILALEPLNPRGNAAAMMSRTVVGLDARVSVRAPHRDVPPELEAICVRATALDPADRYPTARAMEADIERFLAGDRDVQVRERLAAAHVESARKAEGAAALQELGRALALEPRNPEALSMLLRALTTPPDEPPDEVKSELEALTTATTARVVPWAALLGFALPPLVVFVPLALFMGVRSKGLLVGCVSPYLFTALAGYVARLRGASRAFMPFLVLLVAVCVACASFLLGPFIFVPALATLSVATLSFLDTRVPRAYVIGSQLLAVLVPAALEGAGVIPLMHTFDPDGSMRFTSFGVLLPRVPTLALLVASSTFAIAAAGALIGFMADRVRDAEVKRLTQAWQIRQLLPDEAKAKMGAAAAETAQRFFFR